MTTEIQKNANPRLPAPDKYTQYLERLAREDEARREKQRRASRLRGLLFGLACFMFVGAAIGVVLATAYALFRR